MSIIEFWGSLSERQRYTILFCALSGMKSFAVLGVSSPLLKEAIKAIEEYLFKDEPS